MSAICVEGLGATGPHIPETASQYVTADKPETTAAFPVSQEMVAESNPNLTLNPILLLTLALERNSEMLSGTTAVCK